MSVLPPESPSQLALNRRRPGMTEFDSLQDLLEQAGYKETRIFTPITIRMPSSSAALEPSNTVSNERNAIANLSQGQREKSTSGWFNTLWPSSSGSRKSTLNRKQSEPVLSKKARKQVQKNWMGSWGNSKESEQDAGPPPVPVLPSVYQSESVDSPAPVPSVSPLPTHRPRQTLHHTQSTKDLWKGSLHHHRSFPAKLREQHLQGKAVVRKESFDGAGVVAGVGVGASKKDQPVSLRQAFGRGEESKAQPERSSTGIENMQHTNHDSVSSLVDLQIAREKQIEKEVEQEDKSRTAITPVPAMASLFSVAATPILSRQDAVAMRNVDCLDFAGMQHDNHTGRATKGLRKMRSVDALELALARLEGQRQPSFQKPATITESFSTDSLTNEDLASANAVTTLVEDPILGGEGQFEDAPSIISSLGEEIALRRSSTPRLVITSPTGMRSPQPLVLEGQEFEPRSISPRKLQKFRPVPSLASSQLQRPESEEAKVIAKRSTSRRRSRVVKSRGETVEDTDQKLSTIAAKPAKKRMSKSCNDLRGSAARGGGATEANQMSGSERIRALQKHVMERNQVQEVGNQQQYSILSENMAINVPFNQFDDDEDDPFSDFAELTSKVLKSSTHRHRSRDSAPADIDRKMSPISFDRLARRPLSSSSNASNSTGSVPNQSIKMEPTLSRKQSGVGLACLVQEANRRPISPRSSSLSSQGEGNENAPPSLLDSPTARLVKKRSSRIRLGQRS